MKHARNVFAFTEDIQTIFEANYQLMTPSEQPRKEIGFHIKEDGLPYSIKRETVRP